MIPIRNVYYMLSYAFQTLNEQGYKDLATESFANIGELMAAILTKGIANQIRRGLIKNYIPQTEALSSLRGKLNITDSLKTQTIRKKQLVCDYDEFSENETMNRIIKATAIVLLKSNISLKWKKELKKLMVFFVHVQPIDLYSVDWKMRYYRHNQTYRMLIGICELVFKGLLQIRGSLQIQSEGTIKLMDFRDSREGSKVESKLYEKFILNYYQRHYPALNPSSPYIQWSIDDDNKDLLPSMHSDVYLQKETIVLIIDAKYYKEALQENHGKYSQHSGNMYQIFAYVKNEDYNLREKGHSISGMLLYAKTDESVYPDNVYQIHGNQISVKTLDLNLPFDEIARQLDDIVVSHFGVLEKRSL